ncbi:ABC transporter ATP-binding protein [Sulfurospirillum barnesii]|uniref:ABC-type multidrug transport system, ATPase and permease component n=1 Tax=Sulfurospirillum barnesii (strain ATCC 700032 / DSM 10660 / SES-3) TaxID=760154 RepID=I3XY98_SULBS|nr:ABC transporter ATP-binding protein [Sulfurospirillum barnesii]AFL68922.1 ABC-type multidrug transport system, ATPase and permease component [Sulfurospirillum barnesii SES-3]
MSQKEQHYAPLQKVFALSVELAGDYASGYKRSLALFTGAFIAQGIAFCLFYPLLKALFAPTFVLGDVLFWFAWMGLFSLLFCVLKWMGHDFDYSGYIAEVTHDLRTKLGSALRNMPQEELSRYKTGELNAIFSSNVDESVIHMGVVASLFLQITVVPLVVLVVSFFIEWRLSLVMLCFIPMVIPLYVWKRRASIVEKSEFNEANASLEAGFIEYVQGLPVLRALNQTGKNAQNLSEAILHVKCVQGRGIDVSTLPMLLMGILIEVTLLVLLGAGSYLVDESLLALPSLAAMLVIVSRLSEPLSLFLGVIPMFDLMDSAFLHIKSILNTKPLECKEPHEVPRTFDIDVENVDFSYQGEREKALKNVSLCFKERTLNAIVGTSGSGKTTLIKLLMRYADPQAGVIRIGGADIRTMENDALMKYFSVVFQDVYLFDDTILNNIRMGRADATDAEVEEAAKAAFCHEFIARLPLGYHTPIGDIGGSLSGGERQRISIARAILKNAPIVILDEPTAALDTQSEVAVQKAIDALMHDKTIIVIAHRLSTISGADTIFVFHEGYLVEEGTHESLVGQKGKYHAMWSAQQRIKAWNIAS